MGNSESKFTVCNASQGRVGVEVLSKLASTQKITAAISKGDFKVKPTEKIQEGRKQAQIEGGEEYEFILEKPFIHGNVRFIFDNGEREKYLQHIKKKCMIISSSGELVYSISGDRPWISKSDDPASEEINHKERWEKFNEYKEKRYKINNEYTTLRRCVSEKRKKNQKKVDQDYSDEKESLYQNKINDITILNKQYGIKNDGEDTMGVVDQNNKETNSSTNVKGTIKKGVKCIQALGEHLKDK